MKKKLFALLLALALILSLSASVFAYTVPSDTVVYVTETGSCYHRWGCASLKSVAASYTVAYAVALGYYGCSHCHASTLTGTHTPTASSSYSRSDSSSDDDHHDYRPQTKISKIVNSVLSILIFGLPFYLLLFSLGRDIVNGIKHRREKTKPLTDEDGKPLPF